MKPYAISSQIIFFPPGVGIFIKMKQKQKQPRDFNYLLTTDPYPW